MPIPRNPDLDDQHWVPRVAEETFSELLGAKKPTVWSLSGVGGVGKTSLLRRFFNHCCDNQIPVVFLVDLKQLRVSSMRELLMQVEHAHTGQFEKTQHKLRTSYETFSDMLQAYGQPADNAWDLLRRSASQNVSTEDKESLGLVAGAVRDGVKLAWQFLNRKENKSLQAILQKPEEHLLKALREDFRHQGVVLVDTLEQAAAMQLYTTLHFRGDGTLATDIRGEPHNIPFLDYCAGIAHYLLDQPVLMVLAGRQEIRELGELPPEYFARKQEVPAFTAAEITEYLENSLPRGMASPTPEDIDRLREITHGNPFLLKLVVRLLYDWRDSWIWSAEQWQPLLKSFRADDRHGLLIYVARRLASHVQEGDRNFWRLALPRQYVHREMAELLFPPEASDTVSGFQLLKAYEEKGIVYRNQHPDHYFLHDETRDALTAWAKREQLWWGKTAVGAHVRLAEWFMNNHNPAEGKPTESGRKIDPLKQPQPTELLEAAYHALMSDEAFENRKWDYTREQFWDYLAGSASLINEEKYRVITALPRLENEQVTELIKILDEENEKWGYVFDPEDYRWIREQIISGRLGPDWHSNESSLRTALAIRPDNTALLIQFANLDHLGTDEREQAYERACQLSPNANNLGNFAVFMKNIRHNHDQAEALYEQAIEADPQHANHLGNFAQFCLQRGEFNKGKELLDRAFAANPEDPGLLLELWFYRFAHFPEAFPKALDEIWVLLEAGGCSEGWDFSGNIAEAEKDGHPELSRLRSAATAITRREH